MNTNLKKGVKFEAISIKCLRCTSSFTTEIPVPSFVCPGCLKKSELGRDFSTLYYIYKRPFGRYFIDKITSFMSGDEEVSTSEFYGSHDSLSVIRSFIPQGKRRLSENLNLDTGLVEIWGN